MKPMIEVKVRNAADEIEWAVAHFGKGVQYNVLVDGDDVRAQGASQEELAAIRTAIQDLA